MVNELRVKVRVVTFKENFCVNFHLIKHCIC